MCVQRFLNWHFVHCIVFDDPYFALAAINLNRTIVYNRIDSAIELKHMSSLDAHRICSICNCEILTRVLFRSALSSAISSSRSSSVSLACVSSFVSVENSCRMAKEFTDE